MNRNQFVEIIGNTICDEFGYKTPYECANCAVERLEKAGLLNFNKPTEAITGSAHSANTLLGERAASESDQSIGGGGAEHSETAIVRQNEQTKECDYCDGVGKIFIGDYWQICLACH